MTLNISTNTMQIFGARGLMSCSTLAPQIHPPPTSSRIQLQ